MTRLGIELAPGNRRIIVSAEVQLALVVDTFTLQLGNDDTALNAIRGLRVCEIPVLVGSS